MKFSNYLVTLKLQTMKTNYLSMAIGLALAFTSCEKDEVDLSNDYATPEFSASVESVVSMDAALEDVAEATGYEVDIFTGSTEAINSDYTLETASSATLKSGSTDWKSRYAAGQCPLITIESAEGGFPKTITLNYGEKTELANGRILKGVIQIVLSEPLRNIGSRRVVTFKGFSLDTIGVEGTKVITTLKNTDEREVNIVRNLTFTFPDASFIEHSSDKTRIWTAGLDTPFNHFDDIIEVTGFSTNKDSDENEYERKIVRSLVIKGNCRYISSGAVEYYKNSQLFATIDYGNGECDNKASITTAKGTSDFIIGRRILWKNK
jgi:hypothetical protein